MEQINTLILAGGHLDNELANLTKVQHKALIKINNKAIITYILECLKSSTYINLKNIVLVGNKEYFNFLNEIEIIPEGETILDNVKKGLESLNSLARVLIITADIPLIKGFMIDDFINEAKKTTAHFYYPIIPKENILQKFPDAKRTYARIKEGQFTGGNIVLVDPVVFKSNFDLFQQTINNRKAPLKLARQLGFWFLLKLILGKLSVTEIEERIKHMLQGLIFKGIILPYPEVGMDLDKKEDLISIENYLAKNK